MLFTAYLYFKNIEKPIEIRCKTQVAKDMIIQSIYDARCKGEDIFYINDANTSPKRAVVILSEIRTVI